MDIDVDTVETVISFQDGQEVQLEDGSVAYLYHQPKEDTEELAQPVELEDGELAYVYKPLQTAQGGSKSGPDSSNLMVPVTFSAFPPSANVKGVANRGVQAFHCDIQDCDKVYSTAHHLKVHKRIHTGEKPYKCKWKNCNKFFTTGYALKSHKRVHTGEKPFSCPVIACKKAFKTSSDLQKHIRTHTGERPFKCPFDGCGKAFTTSDICKVHIRTHTGERPHKCPFPDCDKSFTNYTNYKNHVRIHTGERPYKCTVKNCGRSFAEYSSLYKHQLVHSGDRPFVCNVCHKTYRQLSTLNNHKKRVHPDCQDFTSHANSESSNFVSISSNKLTALASKDTSVNSVVLLPDNSMQTGCYVVDQSTTPQFSILPSQTASTDYQLATSDNPNPLVVALTGGNDDFPAKFQFESCSVAGESDDASLIYINKNQTNSILFPAKASAADPSFPGLAEENSNIWLNGSSEQAKQPEEISVGTIEINGTKFMVHMIADDTGSTASSKLNSAISIDENMSLPSKDSLTKDANNYFATNSNPISTSNHEATTSVPTSAQSVATTSAPQTTNLNSISTEKSFKESPSTSKPVLFPSAKRRITVKLPRKIATTGKGIPAKSRTILPNLKSS